MGPGMHQVSPLIMHFFKIGPTTDSWTAVKFSLHQQCWAMCANFSVSTFALSMLCCNWLRESTIYCSICLWRGPQRFLCGLPVVLKHSTFLNLQTLGMTKPSRTPLCMVLNILSCASHQRTHNNNSTNPKKLKFFLKDRQFDNLLHGTTCII